MRRWIVLGIAAALLCVVVGVALAAPDCTAVRCVYLPIIRIPPPTPTPIPTPVPPAISTLVIQLAEMKSGYTQDTFKELTNADAAKNYADPNAAALAFQQQGRETSWISDYSSLDYPYSDAIVVSNQVFRYLTITGASDGFQYTIAKILHDRPDFRPFNITAPCCPIVGFRRTFTDSGHNYDQFDIIVQAGRYVSEVQVIGLTGYITVDRAIYYTNIPLVHILNTPQVVQSDAPPLPHVQQSQKDVALPRDAVTVH